MDVEVLARLQFALTIMFHYIFPPLSIGLGLAMVIMEGIALKTGDPIYKKMSRFWTRIFALTFSIGVATGIVMEFEFGTNWATYSRFVGDVFGSALAAEGLFAFFLESGFLAILLFGWDRVGPKLHFFATCMVCLGSHFSAVWIVIANSWMQTPAGYHIVGDGLMARAEIIDFWAMVFNPSAMHRLSHTIVGAWLSGAFVIISISAFYLLKERHQELAKRSLRIGIVYATIAVLLQGVLGDISARGVAKNQPAKMAAFEGLFKTEPYAPLYLGGIPDPANEQVKYGVAIPGMLSFLLHRDFEAPVTGLDQFALEDRPNVSAVFQTYHLMIFMWSVMVMMVLLALYNWRKGSLFSKPWVLRCLVASSVLPQIANQAGWVSAEMGRYPWIVHGLLRVPDGLSKAVSANQILISIIGFGFIYLLLGVLFVYLLHQKIKHGPLKTDLTPSYPHMKEMVKEGLDGE